MSNLLVTIFRNSTTRIMFIIYLLIIALSAFFLIFGYYDQLALQEEGQYRKLQAVVSSIAMEMDGDEIDDMMSSYPEKDGITSKSENGIYRKYSDIMHKVVDYNNINSPMYILIFSEEHDAFEYGIRSDDQVYFRHKYVNYPDILLEKMETGGTIPRYETENGTWISAFYPIRDSHGKLVGVLEADEEFTSFVDEVRAQFLNGAIMMLIIVVIMAVVVVVYARRILKNEEKQKAQLEEQKRTIELKNLSINDSINYALKIQSAILPSEGTFSNLFEDFFILYQPKDIVSGDFYWMEQIGDDVYVAVADCTGHGVPGAMVSVICSNALNRVVQDLHRTKTGVILDQVAEVVTEHFSKGDHRMHDGMDIAFCRINLKTLILEYSGANNPAYVVSKEGFQKLPSSRQPIGDYPNRKEFASTRLQLKHGDQVYMFSDGYADQFGGPAGKKFRSQKFRELIKSAAHLPMKGQRDLLERCFNEWRDEREQVDDVCVLGIRI
ncbi:MAG: SpoIIE family protein phosphatase [Crocinitomicaceae bacterium]|nr:SpoIIE family protein phosphatase [Crocinitomicaceae bacterium]